MVRILPVHATKRTLIVPFEIKILDEYFKRGYNIHVKCRAGSGVCGAKPSQILFRARLSYSKNADVA